MSSIPRYTTEQGNLDPVALRLVIASSDAVPNLTLVTTVSLVVTDMATGASETWTTIIRSASSASLTADHPYELANTATVRTLRITAWLTILGAANPVAAGTFDLEIEARP